MTIDLKNMANNLPDPRSAPGKPLATYIDELTKTMREAFALPRYMMEPARDVYAEMADTLKAPREAPPPVPRPVRRSPVLGALYGGMSVIPSAHAVKRARNFPVSKHRSKRIHKKLCKRFGGEFTTTPAAYEINGALFVHPTILERMKDEIRESVNRDFERSLFGL